MTFEQMYKESTDDMLRMDYQTHRDLANVIALELESRGYKGCYVTPGGRYGDLNPDTRPTRFEWTKA